MSLWALVLRGLRHHRRTHAGVLAGSAVATATLVGALVVGDSVRHTLSRRALGRIGSVDAVLASNDRFFRTGLAADLMAGDSGFHAVTAIQLPAVVSSSDSSRRVHDALAYGVEAGFFALAPGGVVASPGPGEVLLAEHLAQRLAVAPGDEIVLRVEKPSAIPRDMPLALDDTSLAMRVKVTAVLSEEEFGNFGLRISQVPADNLFLSRDWLAERIEMAGRANLLLVDHDLPPAEGPVRLAARLRAVWTLADAELELRTLPAGGERQTEQRELRTTRIFLDDPIVVALEEHDGVELSGVLTYFVNEIRKGERATPYSMVTAIGQLQLWEAPAPLSRHDWTRVVSPLVGEGEIVLGRWVADDLGAGPGDAITLRYYVLDPERGLVERARDFRVHSVVPVRGLAADRDLMPAFPGLADEENCRDWEPGVPVDLDRIRDEDEAYWDEYGGTPKAFLPLRVGRELWSSRFGSLTAVRFAPEDEADIRALLHDELDPAALGLFFRDVRTPALASGESPTDFGGLFIGLSFFLITAALLLVALLFLFGVEQRSDEIGLFAAVGFRPAVIRRLFFSEALVLAVLGGLVGVALGLAYTRLVLWGLATIWSSAVASAALEFHATVPTVLLGVVLALGVTMATVWFTLRRKLREPSFRLMTSEHGFAPLARASRKGQLAGTTLAGVAILGALVLALTTDPGSGTAAAGAFFGAGALVLCGGLLLCRQALRGVGAGTARLVRSVGGLGLRNSTRRSGRSLATVAMMSIGTFLVVAVGVNRQGPVQNGGERDSGTGGFALYGRSSLAIVHDLNTTEGREAFGLSDEELEGVAVVPLRLRAGDDASCLNLARPQNPRLLGVDPGELSRRGAFPFAATGVETDDPWRLLAEERSDGTVPAIGDTTSLTWQLHKAVGDTIEYRDERGRPFTVRIVGAIADTVLQGDLLIASSRFEELFPSQGGHRRFLIDAPADRTDAVAARMSRALEDVGLSLERTGERLDAFHAVQNSYLAIFQMLGALGLLLGSVGLGMVVLRNTLERRGELALATALGFRRADVRWWVLSEYGFLLALGLATGVAAALLAIYPALRAPSSELSLTYVLLLLAVVTLNGLFWIVLAARSAVQGAPLGALSEE